MGRTSLLASAAAAGFFAVMCALPFDPTLILSSSRGFLVMIVYEIGATVPFFLSGVVVSLALRSAATEVDRLYFWDLFGAGLGCVVSVPLMNVLSPPGAAVFACAAFAAAALAFEGLRGRRTALVAVGLFVVVSFFGSRVPLSPAASKHLPHYLTVDRMVSVHSKWTSLFRTDIVMKPAETSPFPDNYEWGLSVKAHQPVQRMWGFATHDASAGAPIYDMRVGPLAFLDEHVLRLPYLVSPPAPRVLVIGVGGGRDVATALRYGASHVDGVELDPILVDLPRSRFGPLFDVAFRDGKVTLSTGEGRHFVERSNAQYDVIQMTGVDTLAALASGAYVLAENYLYTTQAFHAYLSHLTPRGLLSIGSAEWDPNEPQATARMVLVARQALREMGIADPERHIVAVTSNTLLGEILVRKEPFSGDEIARIRWLSEQLAFTPLVLAGWPTHPTYDVLMEKESPERDAFLFRLPYVLDVVTDDTPFFFRFFRWGDLFSQKNYGPSHTSPLGQLVLVVLLASLVVLGAAFIVAPMAVFKRRGVTLNRAAAAVILYFVAIGFGFMLFEISLMQRFALYLGYPTYALTVVLFTLLIFLGVGSYLSRRWVGRERRVLPAALVIIVGLAVALWFGLPPLERATLGAPLAVRIGLSVLVLAPLGTVLGTFFPLGIRRAEALLPDLVPWAWGVNGCASVTGSVSAVIIAMGFGFRAVWFLAVATYAAGVIAFLFSAKAAAAPTYRA